MKQTGIRNKKGTKIMKTKNNKRKLKIKNEAKNRKEIEGEKGIKR